MIRLVTPFPFHFSRARLLRHGRRWRWALRGAGIIFARRCLKVSIRNVLSYRPDASIFIAFPCHRCRPYNFYATRLRRCRLVRLPRRGRIRPIDAGRWRWAPHEFYRTSSSISAGPARLHCVVSLPLPFDARAEVAAAAVFEGSAFSRRRLSEHDAARSPLVPPIGFCRASRLFI